MFYSAVYGRFQILWYHKWWRERLFKLCCKSPEQVASGPSGSRQMNPADDKMDSVKSTDKRLHLCNVCFHVCFRLVPASTRQIMPTRRMDKKNQRTTKDRSTAETCSRWPSTSARIQQCINWRALPAEALYVMILAQPFNLVVSPPAER